jgi:hypothetical protein
VPLRLLSYREVKRQLETAGFTEGAKRSDTPMRLVSSCSSLLSKLQVATAKKRNDEFWRGDI